MSISKIGLAGIAVAGLGSTLLATPAMAATDCGTAPTGGTLTEANGVCQLVFNSPGDYSWTSPASFKKLAVIAVGGGSGVISNGRDDNGYAGNAGKVTYKDFSSDPTQLSYSIHIGTGGEVADAGEAGGDSSVSNGIGGNAVAFGGEAGNNSYCAFHGNYSTYLGLGNGSRTNPTTVSGETCGDRGAGVNPSLGDHDSDGNAVPSLFSNLNIEFARGGKLFLESETYVGTVNPGDGDSAVFNLDTNTRVQSTDAGQGIVYIRWTNNSLANTGTNDDLVAYSGLAAIAAGSALVMRARRRVAKHRA